MGKQLAHRLRELCGFLLGLGCGCHTGQVRAVGRVIPIAFFDDNGVIGHLHFLVFRLGRISLCRSPRAGAGACYAAAIAGWGIFGIRWGWIGASGCKGGLRIAEGMPSAGSELVVRIKNSIG